METVQPRFRLQHQHLGDIAERADKFQLRPREGEETGEHQLFTGGEFQRLRSVQLQPRQGGNLRRVGEAVLRKIIRIPFIQSDEDRLRQSRIGLLLFKKRPRKLFTGDLLGEQLLYIVSQNGDKTFMVEAGSQSYARLLHPGEKLAEQPAQDQIMVGRVDDPHRRAGDTLQFFIQVADGPDRRAVSEIGVAAADDVKQRILVEAGGHDKQRLRPVFIVKGAQPVFFFHDVIVTFDRRRHHYPPSVNGQSSLPKL